MLLKKIPNYYPTKIAKDLSDSVNMDNAVEHLVPEDRKCRHLDLYDDIPSNTPDADIKEAKREMAYEVLGDFQQTSAICTFEESMIFYRGIKLTEKQITALKFIHSITKLKLKGDMVNIITSVIDAAPDGKKDYIEILLRLLSDPNSVNEEKTEATINFIVKEAKKEIKVTRGKEQ